MKRLYRTRDGMLAGVCGGIAAYFDIDPSIVRLIVVALGIGSIGTALLAYIAAAIIIPQE